MKKKQMTQEEFDGQVWRAIGAGFVKVLKFLFGIIGVIAVCYAVAAAIMLPFVMKENIEMEAEISDLEAQKNGIYKQGYDVGVAAAQHVIARAVSRGDAYEFSAASMPETPVVCMTRDQAYWMAYAAAGLQ